MRADINYGATANKRFVQEWWINGGKIYTVSALGIMANATNVPCIIIAFWIGEIEGYPDWLKKSINTLIDFYGYTEIINKPEGCPW